MAHKQSTSRIEWQDGARAKIQTSAVLNRLIDHALSDEDVMSVSQVAAANKLIAKILPDLKSTEITGKDGAAIEVNHLGALKKVAKAIGRNKS